MPDDLKQEDIDALLKAASGDADSGTLAQQEVEALLKGPDGGQGPAPGGSPVEAQFPELADRPASSAGVQGTFDLLGDVRLRVRIELGRRRMYVDDILRLAEGSVVELDKLAGDPVDILVNDVPVARGEVLVLNDYFCVRVTEILSSKDRLASAG